MKKTLLTNLKFIAIGLMIAVSASYAYAAWGGPLTDTFTNNTSTPPAGNTDSPLHTSAADQVKPIGSCTAGNCGGLALGGTFLASRSAEFDGTTFLKGIVGGGSDGSFPASSMLYFGFSGNPTPITVSGALTTNSSLKSTLLANSDGTKTLCSDENGVVGFCSIVDMCSNIAGSQDTVPSGKQQNPDGTCTGAPKRFLAKIGYANYDSYPNHIVGGITNNGQVNFHSDVNHTFPMPWVDTIGLYDGSVGCKTACNEWVYNQIPNMAPMSFSASGTNLFGNGGVTEAGTYHIVVHTSGRLGQKGKFSNSDGRLGIDFALKVNGQTWYYAGAATGAAHEPYPNSGNSKSEYDSETLGFDNPNAGSFLGTGANVLGFHNGNGDEYHYFPFTIDIDKTLHLNQGDKVEITGDIYGFSGYEVKFDRYDYTNWYYGIELNGATFDITETPDN